MGGVEVGQRIEVGDDAGLVARGVFLDWRGSVASGEEREGMRVSGA